MRGDKRQAILAAAARLLVERGAEALRVEEVLACAGAGTGTFYHHFPDGRPDLVVELRRRAREAHREALGRALGRNRDAETGVRAVVHQQVRWVLEEPQLARLLLGGSPPVDRDVAGELRAWAERAGLQVRAGDLLAAAWLGPVLTWAALHLDGGGSGPDTAADRLAEVAWSAVAALAGA